MTTPPTCPGCGLESVEIRCPRCNTLKLIGCSGSCVRCTAGQDSAPCGSQPKRAPSSNQQ